MTPSSLRVKIKSMWHSSGATSELLNIFKTISSINSYWKQMKNDVWLIYLCCLIEKNEIDEFNKILIKYNKMYNMKDVERFLPLSHYLSQSTDLLKNIKVPYFFNDTLKKSNDVYEKLKNNENLFTDLVKDKSIAIVGNSGCEIGLGRGNEIDSHDIVIRFNNYCIDGYEQDYGTKTDIWVRGSAGEDIILRDPSNYKLIVWEADYDHFMVHFDNLDTLSKDLSNFPNKISNFNEETHVKLRQLSGLKFPSTGALTVWATYLAKSNLNNVDVYGFSFIGNNYSDTNHYYGEESRLAQDHDFENEIKFMHNFYFDHKRNGKELKKSDV